MAELSRPKKVDVVRRSTRSVVALSGPIASGKTTLAGGLAEEFGAVALSTRQLLLERKGAADRRSLQVLGDQLDSTEGGLWIARPVQQLLDGLAADTVVVVDAVRKLAQLEALRHVARVFHIHLTASCAVLRARHEAVRQSAPSFERTSFEEVAANRTEASAPALERVADLPIDTGGLNALTVREVATLRLIRWL